MLAPSISLPRHTTVVNVGGALLLTRSVTGPPAASSSPACTVPCAFVALNSKDGGVATASTAT
jgi:hypothetical protein